MFLIQLKNIQFNMSYIQDLLLKVSINYEINKLIIIN